ncbi:hypothetical protein Tco_1431415, partial [Tanacetum coccineum]
VTDYSRPIPSIDVSKDVSDDQKAIWKGNSASFSEQGGSVGNVVSKPMIRFIKETGCPSVSKVNNTKKSRKPTMKYAEMYRSQTPRGNQRNYNNQKSQQLGSDFVMYNKACFICGSFDHVQADYNYHQREKVVSGDNSTRVNYNYSAKKTYLSAQRNIVPRAVLMKTGLRSLNTARHVNTAHPKTTVYSARPMSHFSKLAQSNIKRPYQIRTTLTNRNFSQKVNTAKGKYYSARPKAVNTTRPNSACWVWRPTKLNSASITLKRHNYVDTRGRSKSMMTWVPKEN